MSSLKLSKTHTGTIIRSAFALECAANVLFASTVILYPDWALESMVRSPQFITPTTTFLLQTTGTMLYALSVPLAACLPNTPRAVSSRRIVYYTLGAGEMFLIPLMVYKAVTGEDTGLERGTLWSAVANLAPILAWRVFTLVWKPHWFGLLEEERKED